MQVFASLLNHVFSGQNSKLGVGKEAEQRTRNNVVSTYKDSELKVRTGKFMMHEINFRQT